MIKFSKLKSLVIKYAYDSKESAAHMGAWNDGGCQDWLNAFKRFEDELIVKYDLKPSELQQLNDLDVEVPSNFKKIIDSLSV